MFCVQKLKSACTETSQHLGEGDAADVGASQVQVRLEPLIGLCQRHSGKMNEEQRQSLWFPLLDVVMTLERQAESGGNSAGGECTVHLEFYTMLTL